MYKWSTKTEYVDIETGETLNKKRIQKGEYVILKTTKTKTQKYGNNYQRNYRHECRKNNQLGIEYETTSGTNSNK